MAFVLKRVAGMVALVDSVEVGFQLSVTKATKDGTREAEVEARLEVRREANQVMEEELRHTAREPGTSAVATGT